MALLTIRPLDALARRINEAQHLIERHALRMLEWARFAGEHLIEAKKQCPHGTFKAWVEANCRVSYDQAKKYQAIAKGWDRLEKCPKALSDLTINAAYELVRGENAKPTKPSAASNLPTFTQDDAEYALKIAARIDSDFEGEREVAKAKLEGFAKSLGMTNTLSTFTFGSSLLLRSVAIRVITIDGEPWFVAKDVCLALGFHTKSDGSVNTTHALRHCDHSPPEW